MHERLTFVAVAAALTLAPHASAQSLTHDPNAWRAVAYADLELPNSEAVPYTSLWADRLKENNDAYAAKGDTRFAVANAPASESHIVVRSPTKTVVLSVLHTLTGCSPIREDPVGKATLKRCPMRLAIYQNGRSTVADAGSGCFIEYGAQPNNVRPDLARNGAMGAYDVQAKTIRAGVVFQGEIAPECQFRVPVPQP
ncbi:hypothetical protein B5V01_27725 [Mesorhizobium erdmanii]|uniref:Uncharacterized protein n=2 Tax=Mesorhizobium TaxID=68287 RepID=A0A3M9WZM0_9HYPH|nr:MULTISPECIES: hypothetical protein [Mesorhizobium]RNJ41267.1 hypothetical protein DNR46_35030 [Mesorhizobium japonicum]RXT37910.1 hypothetical protein B5V01_27725 [Mesorhizobium erdmanii]